MGSFYFWDSVIEKKVIEESPRAVKVLFMNLLDQFSNRQALTSKRWMYDLVEGSIFLRIEACLKYVDRIRSSVKEAMVSDEPFVEIKEMPSIQKNPPKKRGRKTKIRSTWVQEQRRSGLSPTQILEKWNNMTRAERIEIDPRNSGCFNNLSNISRILKNKYSENESGSTVETE